MTFDLVVANGTVVDGTEAPGYRADVGVVGETIAAIGDLGRAERGRMIDATGLVKAPGFIDPHTHAEGALLTDPQHAMGLRQGITTELLGIDGMSYAPLAGPNDPAVPPLAGRDPRRAARGPGHGELPAGMGTGGCPEAILERLADRKPGNGLRGRSTGISPFR